MEYPFAKAAIALTALLCLQASPLQAQSYSAAEVKYLESQCHRSPEDLFPAPKPRRGNGVEYYNQMMAEKTLLNRYAFVDICKEAARSRSTPPVEMSDADKSFISDQLKIAARACKAHAAQDYKTLSRWCRLAL